VAALDQRPVGQANFFIVLDVLPGRAGQTSTKPSLRSNSNLQQTGAPGHPVGAMNMDSEVDVVTPDSTRGFFKSALKEPGVSYSSHTRDLPFS
jgi:hypothetical protein